MDKIMFNDRYLLTQGVIDGLKTMTRRIAEKVLVEDENCELRWNGEFKPARYKVGDVVAVAQRYEDVYNEMWCNDTDTPENLRPILEHTEDFGWENKMYVRADLMPHQIRITEVRRERLQDISEEDCLREGVLESEQKGVFYVPGLYRPRKNDGVCISFYSPKDAYAALIDRMYGKCAWAGNPYVYVYTFEKVK